MRAFTFLAGASVATTLPQWNSWQPGSGSGSGQYYGHAVYVMSNDVSGNAVIAMSIGSDGSLSGGSSWPTGGDGSNYVNAKTGKIEFPLALSSQDSLIQVDGVSPKSAAQIDQVAS